MKELLEDVRQRQKMDNIEFNTYMEEINFITKVLEEEKIEFSGDFKLVFYSHMVSFINRLREKISLDCGEDNPEDELDKRSLEVSEKILVEISKKYTENLDRLEVVLAAIQIQLAIELEKTV
ncbi:MAG: hypothetical protein WBG30_00715 [Psychrilyobacter sp.]|uniref:hypothetical protein n=1 Tax=Psychrilyobacter sp. TaxID=2586924 RepID=UPI003C78EF2C